MPSMPVRIPMAESFGEQGKDEGVEADPFLPGAGGQAGMEAFGEAGDEFARSLNELCRFRGRLRDRTTHVDGRGYPGLKSVLAVGNGFLDGFAVRHAAGEIRKGDQEAAAVFLGKGGYLVHVLFEFVGGLCLLYFFTFMGFSLVPGRPGQ